MIKFKKFNNNGGVGSSSSKGGSENLLKIEKKLKLNFLKILEKFNLQGISSIDIAASIQTNDHNNNFDQFNNNSSNSNISNNNTTEEEAELWSALNMATRDDDPFVKLSFFSPLSSSS